MAKKKNHWLLVIQKLPQYHVPSSDTLRERVGANLGAVHDSHLVYDLRRRVRCDLILSLHILRHNSQALRSVMN